MGGYLAGYSRLDMSGGTIEAGDGGFWVGYVGGSYPIVDMSGGTINCSGDFSHGTAGTSQAILNMTGGTINLDGWFEIGSYDTAPGKGHANLHGGTIEAASLSMGGGGEGTMDLAGGTLIIDGDYRVPNDWLFDPCNDTATDDDPAGYTGTIAILADRGLITAYNTKVGDIITDSNYPEKVGLRAVVNLDYDVTNPGRTTITAGAVDPNLAYNPTPLFGSGDIVPPNFLSWSAGDNAEWHDVYFGTSFTEVDEATTPLYTQPLADTNYPVSTAWDRTYYWRIDEVNGASTWKGMVWNFTTAPAWATNPSPEDGAGGVSALSAVLSWDQGPEAVEHQVYLSTDFNDVNDRLIPYASPGANTYSPSSLELDTTYYWAVDEVNNAADPNIRPGQIWSFTTADHIIVDNMESYDVSVNLIADTWLDTWTIDTKAEILLNTEASFAVAGNSMEFIYDNDAASGDMRKYSETEALASDLQAGTDWTFGGVKALVLNFYGQTTNSAQPLYVVVEDGSANEAMVTYDDANGTQEEFWHEWNIDLQDFNGAGVDLTNVNKIYLGIGVRGSGLGDPDGGEGEVYFDSFELYPPRCLTEMVPADFTGDCVTDNFDLEVMASDWLLGDSEATATTASAPQLWYRFDEGTGTTVKNDGNLGAIHDGNFGIDPEWVTPGAPAVDACDPNYALYFDGLGAYVDVNYSPELSLNDFTVSAWVNIATEPGRYGVLGTRVGGDTTFDFGLIQP
jgi:hypothetical protein